MNQVIVQLVSYVIDKKLILLHLIKCEMHDIFTIAMVSRHSFEDVRWLTCTDLQTTAVPLTEHLGCVTRKGS